MSGRRPLQSVSGLCSDICQPAGGLLISDYCWQIYTPSRRHLYTFWEISLGNCCCLVKPTMGDIFRIETISDVFYMFQCATFYNRCLFILHTAIISGPLKIYLICNYFPLKQISLPYYTLSSMTLWIVNRWKALPLQMEWVVKKSNITMKNVLAWCKSICMMIQ